MSGVKLGPALASLLLVGCSHYAPLQLEASPTVLSAPQTAVLAADARAIDRPWLQPAIIDLSAPLDETAIAVLTVVNNPDLKAQRLRAGVADAQAFAAGLLPDPTLSLGVDKVLSGPDSLRNLTGALGLDLNALRTLGVTREKARAEARQVRLDLAWAEWQAASQARIQANRVIGLTTVQALAERSHESAQSLLQRTLRAAGRGDLSADQTQAARLTAVDAAARLRTAERDLAAARSELARLLGLPPQTPLQLAAPAQIGPPPSADALFQIARDRRTDLQALRAGYDAQEAAVRKAVLDQFPAFNLTINGNRDTGGNTLAGPAVDFTLPLWNRNRGTIRVERATRAALKAEYDARLFQTRADIDAAVAALTLAQSQRQDAMQGLPELRDYADASRRAAERGDLSPATAETADQALRDRITLIAQSDQDAHELMIALEVLTGAPREDWTR